MLVQLTQVFDSSLHLFPLVQVGQQPLLHLLAAHVHLDVQLVQFLLFQPLLSVCLLQALLQRPRLANID